MDEPVVVGPRAHPRHRGPAVRLEQADRRVAVAGGPGGEVGAASSARARLERRAAEHEHRELHRSDPEADDELRQRRHGVTACVELFGRDDLDHDEQGLGHEGERGDPSREEPHPSGAAPQAVGEQERDGRADEDAQRVRVVGRRTERPVGRREVEQDLHHRAGHVERG